MDIRGLPREHGIAPLTGEPDQQFAIKGKSAVYIVFGRKLHCPSIYPDDVLVFR